MARFRSQVREVINRNTVVSLALEQGFNAYLPVYDGGVDFILHREEDGLTRHVQLKGRWTINKKYIGRNIWVAFPSGSDWYLAPHDELVDLAEAQGFTNTDAWVASGEYSRSIMSKALVAACQPFRFERIAVVANAAAREVAQLAGETPPSASSTTVGAKPKGN
jgi:hypothetical protein